jgi:hypothetical protein
MRMLKPIVVRIATVFLSIALFLPLFANAIEYTYVDAGLSQIDTHYRETYELNPVGVQFKFSASFYGQWLLTGGLNALSDKNKRLDGSPTQTVFSSIELGLGRYWQISNKLHFTSKISGAIASVDFVKSEETKKHIKEEQLWLNAGFRYQLAKQWELNIGVGHKQIDEGEETFFQSGLLYYIYPRFQLGASSASSEHTQLYSVFGRILFES